MLSVGDFQTTDEMRHYLNIALDNNQLSYGPLSRQFESKFAELHSCKYAILSNSGTSSLLVALQTLKELHGWQNGDEVIVPALTFVATVNACLHLNLKPVLCDIEPDYYGIDVSKIEPLINAKTRCIIPVHTFGQPCNISDIGLSLIGAGYSKGQKLCVIEDSCESMFVKHFNKAVGGWSHIACFSTYMAHLITTGVGGIATTNNPDYAKTMRSLVNHGMAYSDLSKDGNFQPLKSRRDFVFDRIGHSFRITELEAALGLAQLETWQEMISKRQENADYLTSGLQELEDKELLQLPRIRPNTEHAFMMYPIVVKRDGLRDELMDYLEQKGIGSRRMLPLINQPCYKGLWNPADYPVAQWIDDNGYYCGIHQHLSKQELDYIIQVHYDFFSQMA